MNPAHHSPPAAPFSRLTASPSPRLPFSRILPESPSRAFFRSLPLFLASSLCLLFLAGCAGPAKVATQATAELDPQILHVGDVVRVAFPGTQNLDSTQQIRRDGKINLEIVGEVKATDKTPADLEKELIQLYSPHIVSKDVKVTVVSSTFSVFVIGAVMRPGKLQLERAVTAFEAIMEAGGFDMEKANMKAVVIIRHENGVNTNYKLNLKTVLDGKPTEPFKLKAFDTVYVPEKFNWF